MGVDLFKDLVLEMIKGTNGYVLLGLAVIFVGNNLYSRHQDIKSKELDKEGYREAIRILEKSILDVLKEIGSKITFLTSKIDELVEKI